MNVYKHYNQEQLNAQYNNRLHVPDYADYFERWEKLSRQTENEHQVFKNIAYGNHPLECVDIFPAVKTNAKTLVFIHGGYWHLLDKKMFYFLATAFLKYDVTTVFINYPLAPAASMNSIVSSCRKAISWFQNNLTYYNGNPLQLYVSGHSAGGHLASILLMNDEAIFIKAVISLSGLYDLEPVMFSNINAALQMDAAIARSNSPVYLEFVNKCPLLLAVGTNETNEFKDQSIKMYNNWKERHSAIQLLNVENKNHFSILESVIENGSLLQNAILNLMEIEK